MVLEKLEKAERAHCVARPLRVVLVVLKIRCRWWSSGSKAHPKRSARDGLRAWQS